MRVTNDPIVESHPTWSPDGTKIAYAKLKESGLWDIWEIPALGGASRRVIVDATEPAWSPDGRSLAYCNLATGTIWSCDASGGNPRAVTQPDPMYRFQRQPAFSRDGRRIVFVQRQGGPYGEIAVAELAGGQVRVVTHDSVLVYSPVWSADDRFLYFASGRGGSCQHLEDPFGRRRAGADHSGPGGRCGPLPLGRRQADGVLDVPAEHQHRRRGPGLEGTEPDSQVADLRRRARGAGSRLLSRRQTHRLLLQSQGGRTGGHLGHGRGRLEPDAARRGRDIRTSSRAGMPTDTPSCSGPALPGLASRATGSGAWRFRAGLRRSSCRSRWVSRRTSIRRDSS